MWKSEKPMSVTLPHTGCDGRWEITMPRALSKTNSATIFDSAGPLTYSKGFL